VSETLALKYRPQRFADMVGQELVSAVLDRMVTNGKVPTGLLFAGIHGTGKTTAARILAHELNPDFDMVSTIEIDAASHGGVADVRQLIDTLRYGFDGTRVVILDEAHSMTREAFNTLLKTLEDPPPNTVFVLVTTEPQRLPDTIVSRLVGFDFVKISADEIGSRLASIRALESIDAEDELLIYLAGRVDGSMRDAIMALDQCARGGITTLADYRRLTRDEDIGPKFIANLSTGDPSRYFKLLDETLRSNGNPTVIYEAMVNTIRDLMVLKAGGSLSVVGPLLEHRKLLSAGLDAEQMISAMKVLWDLKTRLKFHESNPSNIALALVLLAEVLGGNRATA
jgi:DNA polymerase-3 subunit gamma/tau